ncbi:hypothetical protein ACLQ26_26085 [Micromonospora sp. DT43]|uniref:aromatic-ring hydroxylase C-terminal domain-containing protein n=1 Tax=Micromonospora sp. DT43 TaxID=3393440 RepID=UPI003CEADDFF
MTARLREQAASRRPAAVRLIAGTQDRLVSAYDAADRTLVLIRPDGYIALISDAGDVSALSRYLGAIA